MEKFKVGDVVYDEVNYPNQIGIVDEISQEDNYPIEVIFDINIKDWYKLDGSISQYSIPTLSHTPYEIEFKGFSQCPKVLTDEMKVCIKGNRTDEYGKKIIEYLVNLGGEDIDELSGNSSCYYFIRQDFIIDGEYNIPQGYKEISLKEQEDGPKLKVGTILVAIDDKIDTCTDKPELIKDKEYPIINFIKDDLIIKSGVLENHYFNIKDYKKYFKIKDEVVCYVGKKIEYNGTTCLILNQDDDCIEFICDSRIMYIKISDIVNGTFKIID